MSTHWQRVARKRKRRGLWRSLVHDARMLPWWLPFFVAWSFGVIVGARP